MHMNNHNERHTQTVPHHPTPRPTPPTFPSLRSALARAALALVSQPLHHAEEISRGRAELVRRAVGMEGGDQAPADAPIARELAQVGHQRRLLHLLLAEL
eukprot:5912409-Prymnesium_polylepis.1